MKLINFNTSNRNRFWFRVPTLVDKFSMAVTDDFESSVHGGQATNDRDLFERLWRAI